MTVKYNYKCSVCAAVYLEMRAADEPQIFTDCQACGKGIYTEILRTVISETVERFTAPIEETPID